MNNSQLTTVNNEVKDFNFNGYELTVMLNDNNEPYFIAKEVSFILGYSDTNAMTRRLDNDESIPYKMTGMNMNSTLINESGLYSAILGSKKPEAKAFKKWITTEVLPAIRKTGSYSKAIAQDSYMIEDPVARAKKWIEEQEQAQVLLQAKQQLIDEAQPKIDNYDRFISSDGYLDFAEVSKTLNIKGLGRNTLIEFLRNEKILNNKNKPYQAYVDRNYFKLVSGTYMRGFKTICYSKTVATPRGLEYIKKMIRKVYGDII